MNEPHHIDASVVYKHTQAAVNTICAAGAIQQLILVEGTCPDVLVHRQLSAAIGHTPLHPTLHNKVHVEHILDVVNPRHTIAQRAGRTSVEFYVGLALQIRGEKRRVQEDAYVIRAFRNGLGVFVSKLGLEGLVTFKQDVDFDAENYAVTINGVRISVFDRVSVVIEVEKDKNTRGTVKMTLAEPVSSAGL